MRVGECKDARGGVHREGWNGGDTCAGHEVTAPRVHGVDEGMQVAGQRMEECVMHRETWIMQHGRGDVRCAQLNFNAASDFSTSAFSAYTRYRNQSNLVSWWHR